MTNSKKIAEVVPISLRYSINNYIGVGIGPQFSISLSETSEISTVKKYYLPDFNQNPPQPGEEIPQLEEKSGSSTSRKAFEKDNC